MQQQILELGSLPRNAVHPSARVGDVAEQRERVVREALSWIGTNYHHHGRVKGEAVDCAMLLAEVYERAGIIPHVEVEHYPHDWHLHRGEEVYAGWLSRYAHEVADPKPGDVALFRYGRAYSHGGIVIEGALIVHAYMNLGVMMSHWWEQPLEGRAVRFWSLW